MCPILHKHTASQSLLLIKEAQHFPPTENKGADDFKRQLITVAVPFLRLAQKVETAMLL